VVGVSFEMPIGRAEARARIAAAEADRRRVTTTLAGAPDRIAAEVLNAATRAEQDRFAAGLSTNFFVLTRQNDLALAQLAEIAALTDYRKAQTELARSSGSLLRERGIQLD
jgi:outer membrane protein TolC